MKFTCLVATIVLPLLSAGVQAAEMDEITLEVIDARASSVEDVMRVIEIPRDHGVSERSSKSHPQMRGEHTNVDSRLVEHGRRHIDERGEGRHASVDERGEDRHGSVEERGEDRHGSVEERSEDRRDSVDERGEDRRDSIDERGEDVRDSVEERSEDPHDSVDEAHEDGYER